MENTISSPFTKMATAILLAASVAGCASTATRGSEDLSRVSPTVVRYRGPNIEVAVSHRFANSNLGGTWLFLDIAVTSTTLSAEEVRRDRIMIITPTGEHIPLATQEQFADAFSDLRSKMVQANVAGDSINYHQERTTCRLDFFVTPGSGVAEASNYVDQNRICLGRLIFHVPEGVQAGKYILGIRLEEHAVRIPLAIGGEV